MKTLRMQSLLDNLMAWFILVGLVITFVLLPIVGLWYCAKVIVGKRGVYVPKRRRVGDDRER